MPLGPTIWVLGGVRQSRYFLYIVIAREVWGAFDFSDPSSICDVVAGRKTHPKVPKYSYLIYFGLKGLSRRVLWGLSILCMGTWTLWAYQVGFVEPGSLNGGKRVEAQKIQSAATSRDPSAPQLPFRTPQIPSHRDHKAPNGGTLRYGRLEPEPSSIGHWDPL